MTEKTELEALVAKLVAEELERRATPPAPFKSDCVRPDPTANATMPASARAEMVRVVAAGDLMRDLRGDARRTTTLAPLGADPAPKPRDRSRWRNALPLSNPPGVAQCDRLMDEQARRDRIELIEREARREVARRKAGER
jgi:hypothetical protein